MQCARGDSSQKEGGFANVSEADRDATEAREDFWHMSAAFIYCHHVKPREQLYVPTESSFPIPSSTFAPRERKTNLENLEREHYR